MEKEKLGDVRRKGYIAPLNAILSLTSFFLVPKGVDNIRMVYDGTKSGLNAVLFAPWFKLPKVDGMVLTVEPTTWSSDNDYGKMFPSFWLHPKVRKYTGVDLTGLFPEDIPSGASCLLEVWM